MKNMTFVQFPESLEAKLGRDASSALIELLNLRESEQLDHTIEKAENKFEKRLVEETSKLDTKISNLEIKIFEKFDSHMKWIVGLWIVQMIATMGIFGSIVLLIIQQH